MMTARRSNVRRLGVETLEPRVCLAASVGWDGPGRGHASLSYYIGAPPVGLTAPVVEAAVAKALSAWSSVANITFTRTQVPHQTNSIDITFAQIDGPGGTLAQA